MHKLFFGLLVLGVAVVFQSSAQAQTPKEPANTQKTKGAATTPAVKPAANKLTILPKPDLQTVFIGKAGDLLRIEVINRGGELNNQQTVARVRMYQVVNGEEFYVTGTYASLPVIASGQKGGTFVRLDRAIENCRIQVELDFTGRLAEANENNNKGSVTFK